MSDDMRRLDGIGFLASGASRASTERQTLAPSDVTETVRRLQIGALV